MPTPTDRTTARRALLLHAFVCAAAIAATLFTTHALALERGAPAPGFILPGRDGGPLTLAQFQGKTVYLDFWSSACLPCRSSFAWLNDLQARYGDRGLVVVGIALDADGAQTQQFLAKYRADFAIAYDSGGITPHAFGIKRMPSSVLVGPDGKVLAMHTGWRDADKRAIETGIRRAIGLER